MEHTDWKISKELLDIGVPEESSDIVFYAKISDQDGYVLKEEVWDPYIKKPGMPGTKVFGWTPAALLELLPKKLRKNDYLYQFSLAPNISSGSWTASYRGPLDKILVMYENSSLTEVLVKLVKWYYEENKI